MSSLKIIGKVFAKDLAGMRYEHLQILLNDERYWQLFVLFAQAFAREEVPEDIVGALIMGRMIVLKKTSGMVRGIIAGSILRRLVAKSLAKDFSDIL